MPYLVHSDEDRQAMLDALGVRSLDDLLVDVPRGLRVDGLGLDPGLPELEVTARLRELAEKSRVFADRLTFRGGGVYRRFIPAAVPAVTSKSEFYTAYTPYQPEASQGWLQSIFEFQSLIAELTGMDVANASLYDGATSVGEAAMMAAVQTGRHEIVMAGYVHPEYVEVVRSFSSGRGFRVVQKLPEAGALQPDELSGVVTQQTAAVIFQQPNFLGLLEDARALVEQAHSQGALAIACVDPISLALLETPGEYGADIAVGEGQQLGLAPAFGGPHVGFLAATNQLLRRLPGRLVGEAHDAAGRRGFVLTLQAREQHIRREKATSNICTNHALCALAATVYLTYMGPEGLESVAETSFQRAHSLFERLTQLDGIEPAFPGSEFLNEFPLRVREPDKLLGTLGERGVLGGFPAGRWFPRLAELLVFCCTELNDPAALDQLVGAVEARPRLLATAQ